MLPGNKKAPKPEGSGAQTPNPKLETGNWKLVTNLERQSKSQLRDPLLGLTRVSGKRIRLHEHRIRRVTGERAGVKRANRCRPDVECRVDRVGQVEEVGNQLGVDVLIDRDRLRHAQVELRQRCAAAA